MPVTCVEEECTSAVAWTSFDRYLTSTGWLDSLSAVHLAKLTFKLDLLGSAFMEDPRTDR